MKSKEILKRLKRIKFFYDEAEIYDREDLEDMEDELRLLIEDLEFHVANEDLSTKD